MIDASSPIIFKGVVYNEMKGALADTNALYETRLQQELYKDSCYGFVSGGDPPFITDLTHEQLVAFHKEKYHPSNARIYTYGSFPVEDHLKRVEEKIKGFEAIAGSSIGTVPHWTAPKTVSASGPFDTVGDPLKQNRTSISYLSHSASSPLENITSRILADLLVNGASAPIYSLIQDKLGAEYTSSTGFNPYASTTSVSFGLCGVSDANISTVHSRILETLDSVSRNGFNRHRVDSVFHQIELGMRNKSSSFGMHLGFEMQRQAVHEAHPIDTVDLPKVDFFSNFRFLRKLEI